MNAISINSPLLGTGRLKEALSAAQEDKPTQDSRWKRVARAVSYTTVITLSALADIPFIPVSMPLGKTLLGRRLGPVGEGLGPICALGNSATFFALDWWTSSGIIRSLFGAKTKEEVALHQEGGTEKSRLWKTAATVTAAFFVALVAQTPHVLATMIYNESQYKIAAGAVLAVAGALLPLRSTQLSLEDLISWLCKKKENNTKKAREKITGLLGACQAAFVNISREEKLAFADKYKAARSPEEKLQVLTELEQIPANTPFKEKVKSAFHYAGWGLGAVLALTFQYTTFSYTFAETKTQMWDSNIAAGAFATLAVASTIQVIALSVFNTTKRVFDLCGSAVTGEKTRNLGWQLKPKLSAALTAFGLAMNITALGPNYTIWNDFYSSNKTEHILFPTAIYTTLFALFFTSTLDAIDATVSTFLKRGSEEERKVAKVMGDFQETIRLVQESPDKELSEFLSPQEALLNKAGISVDELAHDQP